MRSFPLIAFTLAALALTASIASGAERRWQSGFWREPGDTRSYIITTLTVRLHLEDLESSGTRALSAVPDTTVKVAVEADRVFVLDAKNQERELKLIRQVNLNYTGAGGGHYVKAVGREGLRVTLEDNSVWELDPRSQYLTADWQPYENISVRRAQPEDGFNYEIDNTDRDNGALARYSPP